MRSTRLFIGPDCCVVSVSLEYSGYDNEKHVKAFESLFWISPL